jgi:Flp pilus assembly protein TadD
MTVPTGTSLAPYLVPINTRFNVIAVLLAVLLLGTPALAQLNNSSPGGLGTPAQNAAALLQKGKALFRQGQTRPALTVLIQAVKTFPGNPEIHFWLGTVFEQMHDLDQAQTAYTRAIAVARDNGMDSPEAHANLGKLLEQRGKTDEAIANYRQALQIDSRFIGAHLLLVRSLLKKRLPEPALDEIQKAAELGCSDPALSYYRAIALRQLGRTAEANSQLQQFESRLPPNPMSDHLKTEINSRFLH